MQPRWREPVTVLVFGRKREHYSFSESGGARLYAQPTMVDTPKVIGICRLCNAERLLLKSHIFSKGLIRHIRGEKNIFVGINGMGRYGRAILQDGQTEALFCQDCEQFASINYEHPFFKLWNSPQAPIPNPWSPNSEITIQVEYGPFKLFHLLNLYRASVSSLLSFSQVSLGPHEEVIRKMLLQRDPGSDAKYAVTCFPVFNLPNGDLSKLITMPLRHRTDGQTMYSSVYGGAGWGILISDGGFPSMRKYALKSDGTMRLFGYPWQMLTAMDEARALLQGKETPLLARERRSKR